MSMPTSDAQSTAARAPVSRPPLVAGIAGHDGPPATSEFECSSFEGSKEDMESERLDREEALRVSDNQLVSSTRVSASFACHIQILH
jgi:hypothetical protein